MVFFTHTHYLKKVERAINLKVHFSNPDFWLKIITSASVFISPIKEIIIAVICLITVDAITGIWASYKRGQKFSSRKFSMTDRKSTRLNSSHVKISYAVYCFTKKI